MTVQLCLHSFPHCAPLCTPGQLPAPPLMPASPSPAPPTCDGEQRVGLALWWGSRMEPATLVWVYLLWPGLLGGLVLSDTSEDSCFPGTDA